jgi:hypothetical protein
MRRSCLAGLSALAIAGGAPPASAQTTVDGFVGYDRHGSEPVADHAPAPPVGEMGPSRKRE